MKRNDKIKYIQTDKDAKDGTYICPSCGSSDVTYDITVKKLKCNYCDNIFELLKDEELSIPLSDIEGDVRGSGTKDIKKRVKKVSMICSGCGAKVLIDMNSSPSQRCHWCHSLLSVNKQRDDGTIPDEILPFSVARDEAVSIITQYIQKKKIFADKKFLKNFQEDDIVGIYLPYVIFDIRGHSKMSGLGEETLFSIFNLFDSTDNRDYNAKVFSVKREFDFQIHELSLESNSSYLGNQIIHSIMPFDTENCVKYHSNYIDGYQYEVRDLNISSLEKTIMKQVKGVLRYATQSSIQNYDRGVHWDKEDISVDSQKWKTAYLPVWIYSYQDSKNQLKYIAVNGRSGEVIGSIPFRKKFAFTLLFFCLIIELILYFYVYVHYYGRIMGTSFERIFGFFPFFMIFTFCTPFFLSVIYDKSRAKHSYEKYAKYELSGLIKKDILQKNKYHLKNRHIEGQNDNHYE